MSTSHSRLLACMAMAALLATPTLSAGAAVTSDDGLVPIKVKGVDKAYKREGASLKGYKAIMIRPVTVAFHKNWNPRDYGDFGLRSQDVTRIREALGKLANETFGRVLAKGGYTIADEPGENVLDVEVDIVDLFVNGPDVGSAADTRTYVFSAGEMRLLVKLSDSVTGTILFRASDFKSDLGTGRLVWANRAFNRMEAEGALEGWARQLKSALDEANAN